MSTKLKAGTATSGAVIDADTAGILELQSGTTPTTGLTINGVQGVSVTNCLAVGNATPSTSGSGITFPTALSASTDANTLDDYEEGTFSPTITPGSGSLTSYTSSGTYIKIGRMVTVGYLVTITNGGTASGTMKYTLPFTQVSSPYFTGAVREYNNTGNWYFTEIDGAGGVIWTSTNAGIPWTNTYNYTWSITYFTT